MKPFIDDISQQESTAAFYAVSFDPEGRGRRAREDYATTLQADLEYLQDQAQRGGTELDPDEWERFRAGCRQRMRAYLSSSSRCVSSFIAGPSNFPAARMNKRADVAHRRLTEYFDYRSSAKRAIVRSLRPDLRPVYAGDADAIDRLENELEKREREQKLMAATNAVIRKHKKANPKELHSALLELGHSEAMIGLMLAPGNWWGVGYAPFQLSNNSANIRRIKQRMESIERTKAQAVATHEGENATLEDDPPANRVRLTFAGKPSEAIRSRLKSCGFRWAPSLGVWQAYRNSNSLQTAREIAG